MFKARHLPTALLVLIFVMSIFVYRALPDRVPMHMNWKGEIDRYGPKGEGAFFFPVVILVVHFVMSLVLRAYVKTVDAEARDAVMDRLGIFKSLMILLFAAMYADFVLVAMGKPSSLYKMLSVPVALLFYYTGVIMKDATPNAVLGVRTTWTMADDRVWAKTHRLASTVYRVSALFPLLTLVWPRFFWAWLAVPVVVAPIVMVVASKRYHEELVGRG
ncbi:MAG: DUF1648 domain-containing protein [Bacillota bacterium]